MARETAIPPRIVEAGLMGGAVAGALDITYAIITAMIRTNTPPIRVLQGVASGLLGAASYDGGISTAALGLLLHFFIAFTAATVYAVASLKLPMLIRKPFLWGPIYGVVVYFFMREVVMRLAGFKLGPLTLVAACIGLFIHTLGIGLPIAYFTSRAAQKSRT
jgi:uncharacterized membrane protein YagU involved in acid resistance